MTNPIKFVTAVTVLLGLSATPLWAADSGIPPRGPVPFETFDSNADGYIDEQEFDRVHSERIQQRAAEGRRMRNAGNAPVFADIDSNGDGRLSPEEHRDYQQQRQQTRFGNPPLPSEPRH